MNTGIWSLKPSWPFSEAIFGRTEETLKSLATPKEGGNSIIFPGYFPQLSERVLLCQIPALLLSELSEGGQTSQRDLWFGNNVALGLSKRLPLSGRDYQSPSASPLVGRGQNSRHILKHRNISSLFQTHRSITATKLQFFGTDIYSHLI